MYRVRRAEFFMHEAETAGDLHGNSLWMLRASFQTGEMPGEAQTYLKVMYEEYSCDSLIGKEDKGF